MKEILNQDCPLCNVSAEYAFYDHNNIKHFWCSTCGEFQVSLAAENILKSCKPETLSEYREHAKQSNDAQVWVITISDTPKQAVSAIELLHGEYVPRSKACRE